MKKIIYAALIALLVIVVLGAAAPAEAQLVMKRFMPKGTFSGNVAVLVEAGKSNAEIGRHNSEAFGPGWEKPGALVVRGSAKPVPDGAYVPQNAGISVEGKFVRKDSRQVGDDLAWWVENTLTGKGSWVKSCGQSFSHTPPIKPVPPQDLTLETDIDIYVNVSATATATATATASSRSSAQGGNSTSNAVINMPQPLWIPQPRILATVGNDRYQVAALTWVPVTRNEISIANSNVNTNTLTQSQSQSQAQAQSQAQSLAVGIGMFVFFPASGRRTRRKTLVYFARRRNLERTKARVRMR